MRRVALMVALVITSCGDDESATTPIDFENTTSTSPGVASTIATTLGENTTTVTTTLEGTTTTTTQVALSVNGDVYTINWDVLVGPVVFAPPGGPDPFYHVHNSPAHDNFFFSVEAYTTYGPGWTGQLGTFEIDCTSNGTGICVHFDPDGNGPMPDLGADYLVTGTIEILQADSDNFVATLTDVVFGDGSTIPGPFTISG